MSVVLEYQDGVYEVRWSVDWLGRHRVEVATAGGSFRVYRFDSEREAGAFIDGLGV